jgi:glycine cleavage system aminomethyltransferase T
MPFTPEHFVKPWQDACELLPPLRATEQREKLNGMFSFTPDGLPVLGESHVGGLWIAEAVWVTHGGGVGKIMAEWLADGAPNLDLRECDINRFDPHATSPSYVRARGAQQYREVYDVIHPLQQMENPRPLRTSPFYIRQKELGVTFFEGRGWERPQWFASNEKLVTSAMRSKRSGWAAQHWSPIAGAEHLATRERVAMFDMTPLVRLEVTGRDALTLLQSLSTNQLAKPVGSVVYTCFCDARGGVKSDVTITRLAEDHFQVGCNGLPDLAWIRAHTAPGANVQVRDSTPGTCCVGVWGPRARDLVQPLSDDDFSNAGFQYFSARRVYIGEVPVMAQRVSYVGELGWEMYTTSDYGLRLWDLLWRSGQPHGVIAAGRAAFESLRIEKGYRLWGVDMHSEYDPYESGLGFTVKLDKGGEFVGRSSLTNAKQRGASRKLCCLTIDDGTVVMGKEPVWASDRVVGYVTSATYGFSVDRSIVYAYLPAELAREGLQVEIEYFNKRHRATVASDPLYDSKGSKLRA